MKQTAWEPRRRIEETYRRELQRLLDQFLSLPDDATLADIMTRLSDYRRLDQLFRKWTERAALKMVTALEVQRAQTWREAAAEGTKGRRIYLALQSELQGATGRAVRAKVRENAELVSSLPLRLAQQATEAVARYQQQGVRAEAIAFHLKRKFPRLLRSRAQLIARTETAKASTALTRARSEEIGADWYVWMTSKDARVRLSHRKMQGVLVRFDDDPSPELLVGERSEGRYAPGEIFNCRCYPAPLLRFDQVSWPHRVYVNGSIRMMTLAAFRRIAESQPRLIA